MDVAEYDIIVCGDSFCSSTIVDLKEVERRSHFSEVLQDQYGYRVLNLAHGGFSNLGIFFQIREAILLRPTAIVYNRTFNARIELMLSEKFNIERGLLNFAYFNPHTTGYHSGYVGHIDYAPILSTTWQGLKDNPFFNLSEEQLLAIDLYIKHMFHDGVQQEINHWLFDYWAQQIRKAEIQPIYFNDEKIGRCAYDFCEHTPNFDTPWHTDAQTQIKIASNIHAFMNNIN